MRALSIAAVAAALLCTLPTVRAQQPKAQASAERSWSELIDNAAQELGITVVYDHDLSRERVAVSAGGNRVSARALLDQTLAMNNLYLEIDEKTRVGRIARAPRAPHYSTPLSEIVEIKHGNAAALAAMLNGLAPEKGNWLRARSAPGGSAVVMVGIAAQLEQARALIAALDLPGAANHMPRPSRQTRVLRLTYLDGQSAAMGLRHMNVKFSIPERAGRTIVLTGYAGDLDAAEAVLAKLDVIMPGKKK